MGRTVAVEDLPFTELQEQAESLRVGSTASARRWAASSSTSRN